MGDVKMVRTRKSVVDKIYTIIDVKKFVEGKNRGFGKLGG